MHHQMRTSGLTVASHYKRNDKSKLPIKFPDEDCQRHNYVQKRRDNIEEDEFEDAVDGGTTIQDPQDFTGLAAKMERK